MKKILLILVIFSCYSVSLFSQESDYNTPFSKLKQVKEEYFKKLVALKGKAVLEGEGSEYAEYQRWLAFWQPRIAPPDGTYKNYTESIYNYYKQEKQKKLNKTSSTLVNTDPWKELGPFKKPNNGLTSIGGGDLGVGIIRDMVINKLNPDIMIAWTLAGGLFVTNNKGTDWNNAGTDKLPRSGCSSADFSPVDPNTLYACSNIGGSYYNNSIGSGGGVYRTTDAGLNWTLIGGEFAFTVSGAATVINKILIHPFNPSIAFVATGSGLYKSSNIIASSPSWTLIHAGHIEDMEFSTHNTGTLVITTTSNTGTWTVEYSANAGLNWTVAPPFPNSGSSVTDRLYVETSEAAPDFIYFLQKTTSSQVLSIFNLNTSIWQYKSTQPLQTGGPAFGVSNFNANTIYLGNGTGFSKSTDGGLSFTPHSVSPTPTNQIHADIESIVTPPGNCTACANEVYICTHGGVSYSNDECTTIYSRCNGLGIGCGTSVNGTPSASSAATDPYKIMLALDHDGTVLSSSDFNSTSGLKWETVFDGDGLSPLIDYSNSNYTWANAQLGPTHLSSTGGSANTYSYTALNTSNNWSAFIYQNKVFPDIVYSGEYGSAGGYNYANLYRSNNRGGTGSIKEQISDFVNTVPVIGWPTNCNSYRINTFCPTSDANTSYIGIGNNGENGYCWDAKILRNNLMMAPLASTVKNNWEQMALPPGKDSYSIFAIDELNPNVAYIGYAVPWANAELYKADYTNPLTPTFINIAGTINNGGLPLIAYRAIVTEKGSNGGIYVATDVGVFYSNNSMLDFTTANNSQWIKLGTNLPNIPISSMEINYAANKLRASTGGRGLWEHDLYCPATSFYNFTAHPASNNFFEVVNSIISTAIVPPSNSITYRAGAFIELNPGFKAEPNSGNYFSAFIHPCSYPGNSF